jgi:hypothetical protein
LIRGSDDRDDEEEEDCNAGEVGAFVRSERKDGTVSIVGP